MKVFNEFRCTVCRQWVSKDVIAVTAETRKNKRGRIAWLRDGICPDLRGPGHSYGIGKYEDADRAYDVYQVLRQHFPHDGREPFSYFDLPECEVVEE